MAERSTTGRRPRVFICHVHEGDAERAARLSRALEERGVEPWLDQSELKGGDVWRKEIESTIRNCDFALVLHSEALSRHLVGYVNTEITLIRERSTDYRRVPFVIPLLVNKLDTKQWVDELKEWQPMPLDDQQFDTWVQDISTRVIQLCQTLDRHRYPTT